VSTLQQLRAHTHCRVVVSSILHVTAFRVHVAFFRDLPIAVFRLTGKVFDCRAFLIPCEGSTSNACEKVTLSFQKIEKLTVLSFSYFDLTH
jgi:hypothetical protein